MSLQAVIPLFAKFTALDGIGPYEVMQRIPDIDITFIGHERGVIRSENGMLGIEADATFDEMPNPDIIVFPGGHGTRALMSDERRPRMAARRTSDDHVHHLGLHRLPRPRSRRPAGRAERHDALECPRRPGRARRHTGIRPSRGAP